MSVKFDAKNFTTRREGPWEAIRWDVRGSQEIGLLKGWHVAPPKSGLDDNVDVVRKGSITVVITKNPSTFVPSHVTGPTYIVVTYWDADPTQVLETVRGDRDLLDFEQEGKWSWCGGGMTMNSSAIRTYLGSLKTVSKKGTEV
jgi:hypothetical protein